MARLLADLPIVLLNPRRDEWSAHWVQSITNPPFREQVEWERDGLEQATTIAMYIAPNTKAPVTRLKMGLHAQSGKLLVCCSEEFWRRGNVEVVCARYGVPLRETLPLLADTVRQ
jgi:hypothetical protein